VHVDRGFLPDAGLFQRLKSRVSKNHTLQP